MATHVEKDRIYIYLDESESRVIAMRLRHRDTWQRASTRVWVFGLLEEVAELMLALLGLHKCQPTRGATVRHELTQISSIAMNWLRRELARAEY